MSYNIPIGLARIFTFSLITGSRESKLDLVFKEELSELTLESDDFHFAQVSLVFILITITCPY